ncbi:MAG: hypothetical protein METHP_01465 [Methanoregula sp. SKADARSKE-2]|nr:MAG: hypothetical protein METHP_01465 [Methanoregula sp. SKADARSKE-2]
MSQSQENPDIPYIPERYRLQIREKERQRLIRKVVLALFLIGAVAVTAIFVLGSMYTGAAKSSPPASLPGPSPLAPAPLAVSATGRSTQPPPPIATTNPESSLQAPAATLTTTMITASCNEPVISAGVLKAQQIPGILLIDRASEYLREDYPVSAYRIVSVDVADTTTGRKLWLFSIKPAEGRSRDPPAIVQMDANTGDLYVPAQEAAKISPLGAKRIVDEAFTRVKPDRIRVRFIAGAEAPAAWNFSLYTGDHVTLSGSLDPETGQITSFAQILVSEGRPDFAVIDIAPAQKIANSYIAEKNGPVSINLSTAGYSPLGTPDSPRAGQYMFRYNRIVQGYPCDVDGFSLAVDSVSGEVTQYSRTWNTPEFAFAASPQPVVLRRDATYDLLKKAQDTYPGLSTGVKILSAEIRWKDDLPTSIVPRPGSIPLAWKVVFDDELMRKQSGYSPAVAWIDAQTGAMLAFVYRN